MFEDVGSMLTTLNVIGTCRGVGEGDGAGVCDGAGGGVTGAGLGLGIDEGAVGDGAGTDPFTCCTRSLNALNSVCRRVCPTSGRELYSASLRENLPMILDCSERIG